MRLATAGAPGRFSNPVVGRVARIPFPKEERAERIFVSDRFPGDADELAGYRGFLTSAQAERSSRSIPTIGSVRDIDHLRTNDIVAMEPKNGFVRTLYRPDSDFNIIFATDCCNSNCLMCSQPPQ